RAWTRFTLRLLLTCRRREQRRDFERRTVPQDGLPANIRSGCLDPGHLLGPRTVPCIGAIHHQSTKGDEAGEHGQIARGRFDEGPQGLHRGYSGRISLVSRSTRGMMTLTRFLML